MEAESDRTIDDLVAYGLTPVQAQVLLTLIRRGRSSAKALAASSDVNRVDVYRALKRLEKLGLVEKVLGSPASFIAAQPEDALDMLVSLRAREIERLKSLRGELAARLQLLASRPKVDEEQELFLKVLAGEQAFRRQKSVISESTQEVLKVFSPHSMRLHEMVGIHEVEAQLAKRGVVFRGVTAITVENFRQAAVYSKTVELRHSDSLASHLRYTIVDRSSLILPVGDPPSSLSDPTALWTNSKALISSLVDDFENLWSSAVLAPDRIAELQAGRVL